MITNTMEWNVVADKDDEVLEVCSNLEQAIKVAKDRTKYEDAVDRYVEPNMEKIGVKIYISQ